MGHVKFHSVGREGGREGGKEAAKKKKHIEFALAKR